MYVRPLLHLTLFISLWLTCLRLARWLACQSPSTGTDNHGRRIQLPCPRLICPPPISLGFLQPRRMRIQRRLRRIGCFAEKDNRPDDCGSCESSRRGFEIDRYPFRGFCHLGPMLPWAVRSRIKSMLRGQSPASGSNWPRRVEYIYNTDMKGTILLCPQASSGDVVGPTPNQPERHNRGANSLR